MEASSGGTCSRDPYYTSEEAGGCIWSTFTTIGSQLLRDVQLGQRSRGKRQVRVPGWQQGFEVYNCTCAKEEGWSIHHHNQPKLVVGLWPLTFFTAW